MARQEWDLVAPVLIAIRAMSIKSDSLKQRSRTSYELRLNARNAYRDCHADAVDVSWRSCDG